MWSGIAENRPVFGLDLSVFIDIRDPEVAGFKTSRNIGIIQLPDPIGLVAKDRIQRFSDEPSAADIVVFCPVAVRILPGKLIDPVSVQCEYESALPDQLLLLNIGGVQGYLQAVIMDQIGRASCRERVCT